jgi:hypothetical protein
MPATGPAVEVRGLRELQAAFAKADRETRLGLRGALREIAEPVRRDAETLATSSIPRIGPKWSKMRTGVTRKLVYVAPRQRGVKTRGADPRRRPNLATLLMDRAMEPALESHEPALELAVDHMLDEVANDFNRGGIA